MEPLRTVMFIDGRNFKYNLRAFKFRAAEDTKQSVDRFYRLDEKHFRWQEFFLGIVDKFTNTTKCEHRLVRVYWYSAATMRPFEINDRLVQAAIEKYRDQFEGFDADKVKFLAKEWYDRERKYFEDTKERVYEGIQRKTDFLEFKYTGEYIVQPFSIYKIEQRQDKSYFYQGTREGEKGVDVGIAVDMIAKMPNYDAAILVSGDADFMPVVRYLKDNLKHVYQFSIAKGIPPRITYLSPWLIGIVDVFQFFDELELLGEYLDRKAGIPKPIIEVIDNRIKQLQGFQQLPNLSSI